MSRTAFGAADLASTTLEGKTVERAPPKSSRVLSDMGSKKPGFWCEIEVLLSDNRVLTLEYSAGIQLLVDAVAAVAD